ncbi:extensin family protein [Mesorhizobium sp. LMG 17147]|uniref:extensin family protein n=1 Tax=Mesorhizobium sp. LMG 17147 TaxID=2963091 RepID=UPI0020C9BB62|nr:extensin family protein [Mesorhizobium sp. LMG 17147]MCP9232453.1 extensin family protein [Mesorhizobium sp. LMG 17147]
MAAFGFFRLGRLLLAVAATPLAGPVSAKASELPPTAPVPQRNQQVTPPAPTEIPVPEPRPAPEAERPKNGQPQNDQPQNGQSRTEQPKPPAIAPQPPEKPAQAEPPANASVAPPNPAEADEKAEQEILPDPRSVAIAEKEMPAEELACRRRLKSMGVDFEERKPEHDTAVGCSIPYPIVLRTLGKSIAIGPEPELNCQMAEAAARFAAAVIQPAAKAEFGEDLKSIGQASAFVCRSRNGGGKLSEHAFGNALDIASFKLSDGKEIDVGPAPPEKDAKFLNAVRKAACGPFKTVLGPGSDADHSQHLHFDLEPRRNGGTFCQ